MRNHAEHDLQVSCVRWFRYQYPQHRLMLFAIPNGAKLAGTCLQRAKAWKRLEAEGAVKGAADLLLSVPSGDLAGLFIEMKTPKGQQSPHQREFERAAIESGYGYAMPRSTDEFMKVVKSYFKNGTY